MKNRIALVFPGQGSQYIGMGKEFYDNYRFVQEIYEYASQIVGYDIGAVCFKKQTLRSSLIHRTVYTQPAVLTTSYACYRVFERSCCEADIDLSVCLLAGHSLGEYTALLIAGAMDFKTCLSLVKKRATYMTELGRAYPGAGLMAIIDKADLDYDEMRAFCRDFMVYFSLENTKKQMVVGGSKKQLAELSKKLKEEGKLGAMLKVEGPFHTPIMKPAAEKLRKVIENCELQIASKPIVANVSAEPIIEPSQIIDELYKQIYNSIDWMGSIRKIIEKGVDLIIEVGPKKVMSNMIKDIDQSVPKLNVEDLESLERTIEQLLKFENNLFTNKSS